MSDTVKPLTPEEEQRANRALDRLEGAADKWAEDVMLVDMVNNMISPMDLRADAPPEVVADFKKRMAEQIDAVIRQAWAEGALQGGRDMQDKMQSRIAALEGREAVTREELKAALKGYTVASEHYLADALLARFPNLTYTPPPSTGEKS